MKITIASPFTVPGTMENTGHGLSGGEWLSGGPLVMMLGRAGLLEHCVAHNGDQPDVRVLGESAGLPALRTLRLGRLPVEVEEPLLAALIDSPLMARIARLEVEWLNDRPDTRDWLDAHRSQLARVAVSDIREYSELFCPGL